MGRGRPLVLLPIHLKTGSRSRAGEADTSLSLVKPEQSRRSRYFIKPVLFRPIILIPTAIIPTAIILIPTAIIPTGEYLLKTSEGRPPAGRGQANMALHGPVCWPNIAKSGRLCQHGSWLC